MGLPAAARNEKSQHMQHVLIYVSFMSKQMLETRTHFLGLNFVDGLHERGDVQEGVLVEREIPVLPRAHARVRVLLVGCAPKVSHPHIGP